MALSQFSLEVTSDHAVPIPAGATVTNSSGDTLYYADFPGLTSSNNVGSLSSGSSATFATASWVRSATLSTVAVTTPGAVPGSAGAGSSVQYAVNTAGQLLTQYVGSDGVPDTTLNPATKVNRTVQLTAASVQGDGSEQASGLLSAVSGSASNQVQTVALMGVAKAQGTTNAGLSPDACGVYGVGRIFGSGIGVGIGGFFIGRTDVAASKASGLQVDVYNNTGSDVAVNTTGFSPTNGIWLTAQGNKVGAGLELGNPFGTQFDAGLHFSGQTGATRTDANAATNSTTTVTDAAVLATDVGRQVTGTGIPANTVITSVSAGVSFVMNNAATATNNPVSLTLAQVGPSTTADIQSDSTAKTGVLINGTHSTAALAVAAGSGPLLVGETTAGAASSLLEVAAPAAAKRPLAVIGSVANTFNYSMYVRNGAGVYEYFVSAGTDNIITGTISGDGGVAVANASKFFHIGGTTSVIKVGNANTLGFFNATAVAKQTAAGNVSVTAAGATNTVFYNTTFTGGNGSTAYTVGDLVAALKAYGLLTV